MDILVSKGRRKKSEKLKHPSTDLISSYMKTKLCTQAYMVSF